MAAVVCFQGLETKGKKEDKDNMLFSSMIFIWIFLPAVIGINFLLSVLPFPSRKMRIRIKNVFLLVASLLFYAWGNIAYLPVLLFSILFNFYGGLLIGNSAGERHRKSKLAFILGVDICILILFKYFGLIVIGISFFTFQAMSYVVDVYMGKVQVQKKISDFALYVSFFPQLVAGPIVKYGDIERQLEDRQETVFLFAEGQKRFCYGLGKKVLLANTFAEAVDKIWAFDTSRLGSPAAWIGIVCYTLQIYYDFSGYSDMAIGLGRMLGFRFGENFAYPYTSLSIREFWRRWHISLSSWFKEYVYIPLGGSRQGQKRTYANLFFVFLLTGAWHGANITFVVWGMYYALLLILERMFLGRVLDKNPIKVLNWIYSMFFVMLGWVVFRSDSISQAMEYVRQMFSGTLSDAMLIMAMPTRIMVALPVGLLFAGLIQRLVGKQYEKIKNALPVRICDLFMQTVILILSIFMLVNGTYNPFIYFQF